MTVAFIRERKHHICLMILLTGGVLSSCASIRGYRGAERSDGNTLLHYYERIDQMFGLCPIQEFAAEHNAEEVIKIVVMPSFDCERCLSVWRSDNYTYIHVAKGDTNIASASTLVDEEGKIIITGKMPDVKITEYSMRIKSDNLLKAVNTLIEALRLYNDPQIIGLDGVSYKMEYMGADEKVISSRMWSPMYSCMGSSIETMIDLVMTYALFQRSKFKYPGELYAERVNEPWENIRYFYFVDVDEQDKRDVKYNLEERLVAETEIMKKFIATEYDFPLKIPHPAQARYLSKEEFDALDKKEMLFIASPWRVVSDNKAWYCEGLGYVIENSLGTDLPTYVISPCCYPPVMGMHPIDGVLAEIFIDYITSLKLEGHNFRYDSVFEGKDSIDTFECLQNMGVIFFRPKEEYYL